MTYPSKKTPEPPAPVAPRWLNRTELAKELTDAGFKISPHTLTSMASRGNGPPYVIFGKRAMYDAAKGHAWAVSRLTPGNK